MDKFTLVYAIKEARRFLDAADALDEAVSDANEWPGNGSIETSAVRRSSMDLTRALAALRKR